MKHYITFGQIHRHEIFGIVFDKDCVACFECDNHLEAYSIIAKLFKSTYHHHYDEESFDPEIMKYFPRGIITFDPRCPYGF